MRLHRLLPPQVLHFTLPLITNPPNTSATGPSAGTHRHPSFSDVSEVVQEYLDEIPPTESIGVLETAKAYVISAAIKVLRGRREQSRGGRASQQALR